jgi:hypothetical protein
LKSPQTIILASHKNILLDSTKFKNSTKLSSLREGGMCR